MAANFYPPTLNRPPCPFILNIVEG